MRQLRVKLILNEGGEGVPLSQLTNIADEAEKFLRYLAEDAGISVKRNEWLARNFANGSVRFDIERETRISQDEANEFVRKFEYVDGVRAKRHSLNGEVKHRTLTQYTKVAGALGPHEKVAFGLYRGEEEEKPSRYVFLTKRDAELLAGYLAEEVTYNGSVYGTIHDLVLEDLRFHLRHHGSGGLVRCEFREDRYKEVHEACEARLALVYVYGLITARRVDRQITKVRAEKLRVAPRLTEERYRAFFGADPQYTGQLSSEDFVERSMYEQ